MRGVALLSAPFDLWETLLAFAANPLGQPAAAPARNLAANVSYTVNDLLAACALGETRGFIAGVILTAGLVYFWQRWLSKQWPRPPNRDKPPAPT